MQRTVGAQLVIDVAEPAEIVLAVAAAERDTAFDESFTAVSDGVAVAAEVVPEAHGTRLHRIAAPVGRLVVDCRAVIDGRSPTPAVTDADRFVYLRPSRYAESDTLAAVAAAEFEGVDGAAALTFAVSSWVGTQLSYVSGSSRPTDGAVQTLLARQGVCRDFAHVCVALLRSLGVPARLAAVYAPGLDPMDFHAVAEAAVDGRWRVVDATALAPRSSLVRIATGRDAADTAFMSVLGGRADLVNMTVSAVADALPDDDLTQLVSIA
ncbi:MAG: transglutaminase family protein [Microbacterium sp.]|uniref:transglutaminase-like domain-containing protein n=1 Tax=Microbacterium sp. TaxID=51671 RepID=UPI0039E71B46